jgi:predicted DCC family thiol-disulfide oxidoreductase YuxK
MLSGNKSFSLGNILLRPVERLLMNLNKHKLKVIYDGECPLCIRTVKFLKRMDWLGYLEYQDLMNWDKLKEAYPPLDLEKCFEQMHVISPRGEIASGFFGFRKICARLVPGWLILPFLFIPGVPTLGQYFYLKVTKNRRSPGIRCRRHACV